MGGMVKKGLMVKLVYAAIMLPILAPGALAQSTNLPIPRFVTIKATEANVRTGPSVRYPVEWVYHRRWLPVEITAEFEQWRKIKDKDGDEGWIHESMLSGRRYVFIKGKEPQILYRLPDHTAHPMVKAEPWVMGELLECRGAWCKVDVTESSGWIERSSLWGIYPDENIE